MHTGQWSRNAILTIQAPLKDKLKQNNSMKKDQSNRKERKINRMYTGQWSEEF